MWANVFLFILIVGLTGAGYKRGLIHEITDWCVILGAGCFALRLYRPLGNALHGGLFKGWTESATMDLAFWVLFLPAGLTILSVGLHIDRVTKEQGRIPKPLSIYSGMVLAFIKSMVLACLFVAWIPNTDNMTPAEKSEFHDAYIVNLVRSFNPIASTVVALVAPADLAHDFYKMMQKR